MDHEQVNSFKFHVHSVTTALPQETHPYWCQSVIYTAMAACWPMEAPVDQSSLIWLDGILKEQPDGSHQSQSVRCWLWFTSCSQKAARCYLTNDAAPQSWKTWRWCSNRNQYLWLVSWLIRKIGIIMFLTLLPNTLWNTGIIYLLWPKKLSCRWYLALPSPHYRFRV